MNCRMCGQPSEAATHEGVTLCLDSLAHLTKLTVNRWMDRQATSLAHAFADPNNEPGRQAT